MKTPPTLAARALWLLLVLGPRLAAAADDAPQALAREAEAANPSLQARAAMVDQLRARAEVAGAWPDPMVGIEYSNVPIDTWSLSDHPMAGLQLRVQQTLRPPAWSRQARAVGEARTQVGQAGVEEAGLALRAQVESTWWTLARTRQLHQVTAAHLARTEELLVAVRARYEVGAVGQSALLRMSLLCDRIQDELGDFDRTERELGAALDTALSRQTPSVWETPAQVSALQPPPDADWLALAAAHRPELQRLEAERQAADAAAALTRTDGRPDPVVWAGYRLRTVSTEMDPGTDLVSLGVSVPLPFGEGRRAKGEIAGWQAAARAADSGEEALRERIVGDMDAILARWSRAAQKAATYDKVLLPAAAATLDATRTDFAVGRAEFAALFEAEIALLDLERSRISAAIETRLQQSQALLVLGTDPLGSPP